MNFLLGLSSTFIQFIIIIYHTLWLCLIKFVGIKNRVMDWSHSTCRRDYSLVWQENYRSIDPTLTVKSTQSTFGLIFTLLHLISSYLKKRKSVVLKAITTPASPTRIAIHIYNDPTHPLHSSFQLLPSDCRVKVPLARKNLYKNSFIPTAVNILNSTLFK